MIGTAFMRASLRITRASSKPSMRGISTSSSTTSGIRSCIFSSASTPSFALSTRKPSRPSRRVVILRTVSESSTTSTSGACEAALASAASAGAVRSTAGRGKPAQRSASGTGLRIRITRPSPRTVAPATPVMRAICGPMFLTTISRVPSIASISTAAWLEPLASSTTGL